MGRDFGAAKDAAPAGRPAESEPGRYREDFGWSRMAAVWSAIAFSTSPFFFRSTPRRMNESASSGLMRMRKPRLDIVLVLFQERTKFAQKKFLKRWRESAIPQGSPKIGRGANSCALKTAASAIDSKGEISLARASRRLKE
jgi:hypothetical protein